MAPYGDDITEPIPYVLSNPAGAINFSATGVSYDISVAGLPFFVQASDDTPYRRVTAQYRKQQYDQTREAGEQSLTGWWFRSQSSFHLGQGIKYFEPAQDEGLRFQYTESKGLDVWTKGQVSLILDTAPTHVTTTALRSNGRPGQYLRSIKWTQNGNSYNGCLMLDGYDLDKIFAQITATITNKALTSNVATLTTSAAHGLSVGFEVVVSGVDATFDGTYTITAVTSTTFSYAKTASNVSSTAATGTVTSNVCHFVDYNAGTDYPVYAYCDDGVYAYWITKIDDSGVIKTAMYKKLLTATEADAATQMWKTSSVVVTDAVMEFTKERIVACINNKVYEIATSATALPTAVYTHPVDDFVYTSITSSGAAIYVTGYSGSQSNIQKFTLASNGTMPTLTSAITAAEMPSGELIYKIYYYLGYIMIGTNKGIRVAAVSDQDGSLNYGPLIVETSQPCYDFAARDHYVWCATGVDGNPGVIRIDLSNELETLRFAWANDLYIDDVTGHPTTGCAFANGTDQLVFCTAYASSANGGIYIEDASTLRTTGYLTTGNIRYGTLEPKNFKRLLGRGDFTYGSMTLETVDKDGTEYDHISYDASIDPIEVTTSSPATAQEYVAYKFILYRDADDSTQGPIFKGYQAKATIATPRQRVIQFPVYCYDLETDRYNSMVGYEGKAFEKILALEDVEELGDVLTWQDLTTGESRQAVIEQVSFQRATPPDKRFSGFGGVIQITIRTV